jgi:hypothetical protein
MATVIFDSHAFRQTLDGGRHAVGAGRDPSDEHARVFGEQPATKQDVALLRADLVAMEQRIKDQLTIRLGAMLAAAVAIVAALVKLL